MSIGDICPSKEASPRKSVNVSCDTASSGYCSGGSNKRSSSGQPPPGWRPSCSSAVAGRDLAKAATELNAQGMFVIAYSHFPHTAFTKASRKWTVMKYLRLLKVLKL